MMYVKYLICTLLDMVQKKHFLFHIQARDIDSFVMNFLLQSSVNVFYKGHVASICKDCNCDGQLLDGRVGEGSNLRVWNGRCIM